MRFNFLKYLSIALFKSFKWTPILQYFTLPHEAYPVSSLQKINLLESQGEYYFLITHAISFLTAAWPVGQKDATSPLTYISHNASAARMLEWFKEKHFSNSFCFCSCSAYQNFHCTWKRYPTSAILLGFKNHVPSLQN